MTPGCSPLFRPALDGLQSGGCRFGKAVVGRLFPGWGLGGEVVPVKTLSPPFHSNLMPQTLPA